MANPKWEKETIAREWGALKAEQYYRQKAQMDNTLPSIAALAALSVQLYDWMIQDGTPAPDDWDKVVNQRQSAYVQAYQLAVDKAVKESPLVMPSAESVLADANALFQNYLTGAVPNV